MHMQGLLCKASINTVDEEKRSVRRKNTECSKLFLLLCTLQTCTLATVITPTMHYVLDIVLRLCIRGFLALTCLTLSARRCLPLDPRILSNRHGRTPICQNSVSTPRRRTNVSLTLPRNPHEVVRKPGIYSGKELKNKTCSRRGVHIGAIY